MVCHRFSESLAPQRVIAPSSYLNDNFDGYRLLCWKLFFSQNVDGIIPAFANESPEVSLIPTFLKGSGSVVVKDDAGEKQMGEWVQIAYIIEKQ